MKILVQVGRKCADLWVSPDQSVIVFIAVEKPFIADVTADGISDSRRENGHSEY